MMYLFIKLDIDPGMCAYASPTLRQTTGKGYIHMNVKPRSYLTAGIAALGVGAIALAPVQPIPNQLTGPPERMVNTLAVSLAAAVDPIQAWVDTFETTFANIGILGEFYMQKPFPLLQTIAANTATYLEEATNGNAGVIPEQIWGNIQTFFQAPWSPGALAELGGVIPERPEKIEVPVGTFLSQAQLAPPPENPDAVNPLNPFDTNLLALQAVAGCSVNEDATCDAIWDFAVAAAPLWRFLDTPFSGQLLGLIGPLVAPLVSLTRSFTAIGKYFEAGDVQNALFELINIPANMTNAVLNGGGFLDLTGIIGAFVDLPSVFDGVQIGVRQGGLLNAIPLEGSFVDPNDPQKEYASGVGLDSFSVPVCTGGTGAACNFVNDQPIVGLPNGWLGSTIGLGQYLADQMLVTPAPPPAAEPPAETAAATQAAPVDLAPAEAPAEESAPVIDVPAPVEESAPVEVVEDPAPVVEDTAEVEASVEAAVEAVAENEAAAEIEAAVESVKASAAEPAEAATPAAEDSGPEAADDDKSDDDTDRSGSKTRRGAN
jgi:hypothetical protein